MSDVKLAIFGASVSAQRTDHKTGEITGYAQMFREVHQAGLGFDQVRQITYEGNRFSDGGLAQLHEVLRFAPDICLFEPLIEDGSRGVPARLEEFQYAYQALLKAGILPVSLFLPDPQRADVFACPNVGFIRRICQDLGLPKIEVPLGNIDREVAFRGVHTRRAGAELYAQKVADGLRPHLASEPRRALVAQAAKQAMVYENQTCLREIKLPPELPGQVTGLSFEVTVSAPETLVRLVGRQEIGPFSPILRLRAVRQDQPAPEVDQTRSVWDVYCHYPRSSFVVLGNVTLPQGTYRMDLVTTDEDPDYDQCRGPIGTPPPPQDRHLRPKGPVVLVSNAQADIRFIG